MPRRTPLAPRIDRQGCIAPADELPVVARLVVEVRSDGTRTVARGSLADARFGEVQSVEVKGASPYQFALSLMTALLRAPAFASAAARALLPARANDTGQGQGASQVAVPEGLRRAGPGAGARPRSSERVGPPRKS